MRLLRALLLAGALLEVLNAAFILSRPDLAYRAGAARSGAVISTLLAAFALWPQVRLEVMQRAVVGVLCAWFALNVAGVTVTQRPTSSGLLLQVVIVALVGYTWLPSRVATGLVASLYALLLFASSRSVQPDVPGVALTGFILPLIWYLTQHGRAVVLERDRRVAWQALAHTDALTGLVNRRAGKERLQALCAPGRGEDVLVVLFDLDHFKQVNDRLGHAQGDQVLVDVAEILRDTLHESDLLARWGGEEFLAALSGPPGAALQRAEVALHAVRQANRPSGTPGQPLTVSAGLALSSEAGDLEGLLELADQRLYHAKAGGRDRLIAPDLDRSGRPVFTHRVSPADHQATSAGSDAAGGFRRD